MDFFDSSGPKFKRSDVAEIVSAHAREEAFKTFLFDRFVAYTNCSDADAHSEWSLSPLWLTEIAKGEAVTFVQRMRSGGSEARQACEMRVPVGFIFDGGLVEDEARAYARRVRTRAGQEHARYVFVQAYGPRGQQVFAEWKTAGCPRTQATDAYRTAHTALMSHPGDLKDVRRQVMDAARFLHLSEV